MQPTHKYLSNLTPLRGIAALWVVVFHFSEIVAKFVSTDRTLLLTKGYLMVDLFFIMSGFIICHVYQKSFQSGSVAGDFRQFIVARFARIYPLHFVTLLLCILIFVPIFGWDPLFDNPRAIPTNLLLIHSFGIHDLFNWNVPSWSISAEWWAYMVFPFLAIFLNRKKGLAVALLALFALLAYLSIIYWLPRVNIFDPGQPHRQNLDVTFDYGFLRGLAGFISGMLVYKAYESRLFEKFFHKDIAVLIFMTGSIICMHYGWNDGFNIIFFIGVVYSFALNSGRLHELCNSRIAQYLGKISYSIYLMQLFPIIPLWLGIKLPGLVYPISNTNNTATTSFWIGVGYCLIYMMFVIGVASLTYFTIEKPCRKWINAKWGKEAMPVYA
jgi:peptidoglycan/LPS O-acetylase OafA/YrhL